MASTRREFLQNSAAAAAFGAFNGPLPARPRPNDHRDREKRAVDPRYRPVVTPNGTSLPFKEKDGVRVYHLVPQVVQHEFAPGLEAECWGYNGRVHGPTIEAVEGDRVRIYVTNRLPAPTTVHWHGMVVPSGMDGVGGLSQRPIEPGETFKYEFTIGRAGTFMYHSHHDEMTQMALGLMGMIVVHPRAPTTPPPDRDYALLLSEWSIRPGSRRPDPNEMTDFNVLTFNAKVFPATAPLVAKTGERVRVRIGNLSAMDHHPIHLHGHSFLVTETDGGTIPESARWPETTVLVPVGSTRTIELTAYPGDWALHCHMTHHVMTQMGHGVPNLIGVDPSAFDEKVGQFLPQFSESSSMQMGESESMEQDTPKNSIAMMGGDGPQGYITMGGMFTILKVRDEVAEGTDPDWYPAPEGSTARPATSLELSADGIDAS